MTRYTFDRHRDWKPVAILLRQPDGTGFVQRVNAQREKAS
jgi:hypothetical protein